MISLESDDPLPRAQPSLETSLSASSRPASAQPYLPIPPIEQSHHGTGMASPILAFRTGRRPPRRQLWPLQASTHLLDSSASVPCETPVLTRHITAMGVSSGVTFQLLELLQAACESPAYPSVRTSNMVDTKAGLPLSSMRAVVMPMTLIMSCTISALDVMIC